MVVKSTKRQKVAIKTSTSPAVVNISKDVHTSFKAFCQENGFKIGQLTDIIIAQFLKQQEQGE